MRHNATQQKQHKTIGNLVARYIFTEKQKSGRVLCEMQLVSLILCECECVLTLHMQLYIGRVHAHVRTYIHTSYFRCRTAG